MPSIVSGAPTGPSSPFLSDAEAASTYAPQVAGYYRLGDFGTVDTTGVSDMLSLVDEAIAAIDAAGGGVLEFPAGTIRLHGTPTIPNDGVTAVSSQVTIILRGAGATKNSNYPVQDSGTILKFTATPSVAHIDTRGSGYMEIEGFTFTTTSTAGKPFVRTSNTVIDVHHNNFVGPSDHTGASCVTDAVQLGGAGANGTFDMTTSGRFQGYGTRVWANQFERIQRGVYMRGDANSVVVTDNWFNTTCGGSAAFEIASVGTSYSTGNYFAGNIVEVVHYDHGIVLYNSPDNTFVGNAWWDYLTTETMTSAVSLTGTAGVSTNNKFLDFFQGIPVAKQIVDSAGSNQWMSLSSGVWRGKSVYAGGANGYLVQPATATGAEAARLIEIKRAGDESVSPGLSCFYFQQNGLANAEGVSAGWYATSGSTTMKYSWDGVVKDTGDLPLYAGSTTGDAVRIMRGTFRAASFATGSRPSAVTVGAGAHIFDSTLNQPIWSNGTVWKDAMGNTV